MSEELIGLERDALTSDHGRQAMFLNFIGEGGEDRVVAGFGRGNYARLAHIKGQYDPDNVFRLNHNIRPAIQAAD